MDAKDTSRNSRGLSLEEIERIRRNPPLIMGHEASGEVLATGPRVTAFKAGDRVTFDSTIYCGKCHFCRDGHVNLCDNRRVVGVSPAE